VFNVPEFMTTTVPRVSLASEKRSNGFNSTYRKQWKQVVLDPFSILAKYGTERTVQHVAFPDNICKHIGYTTVNICIFWNRKAWQQS